MSKAINRAELVRHLERMDGRTGDVDLYRHLMSKDEESGKVEGNSYRLGTGYSDVIKGLQEERHQYVTLALFSSSSRRTKSTVRATSGLYVDLDDSLFNGDDRIALDLINKTLTKARIPEPTMVIHTGGGWHVYWLFNSLYYINGDEDIKKYESVITSIINSLSIIGADPKSKDVTRLLRLAGTINHKYNLTPAVTIVESNDLYYGIGDFEGLRVVKNLPKEYDLQFKKEVIKQSLTIDEPAANKKSQVKKEVIKQSLTRPDEEFPIHLVGAIIADAQDELERRNPLARYMEDVNQSVIIDLLLNYIGLPRNQYVFEDGSAGQYVLEGSRNHYLWALARRGVSDTHLSIINRTLLLPSLNHSEFKNVLKVGRGLKVPKINSIIRDLSLTLSEQSTMVALKINYGSALDNQEKFINTRVNQLLTESHFHYIQANPGRPAKELAAELGISVSRVYQLKKQKGGDFMSKDQRRQEVREMFIDLDRTSRIAIEEIYENYFIAGQAIDKIIHNQGLLHSLRVRLTEQQKEDIKVMAENLISKVEVLTSQLESYEEFITDDSEYFKSGKIKKTVLLEKVNKLKASMQLITATGAV